MSTSRKRPENFRRRYEVVVCESHREANQKFREDIIANTPSGEIDSVRMSELTMDFHNGTVRRYFSGQDGPERVMGMEVHEYFNLIRSPRQHFLWERELSYRAQRYQEITLTNVTPEPSVWWLIKEEYRMFFSSRSGRLAIALMVIMLTLFFLWLTAPRLP